MASLFARSLSTHAPAPTALIRLMVGGLFLSEGVQKFLYPADLAAGRFAKIGLPAPEMLGPLVGATEVLCGTLVLLGWLTRWAALPLLITMVVAWVSTKLPILLGQEVFGFALRPLPRYGWWPMLHESRNDLCLFLGSAFLLMVGAGRWSIDAWISRRGPLTASASR